MSELTLIACSIFKSELEQLKAQGLLDVEIVYLDSMLHMNPGKLENLLNKEIEKHNDKKIIIIYGDCHPHIIETENSRIKKVKGINCCEIFLGFERYLKMRKAGSFVLLPEWLKRWEQVFKEELGFTNEKVARNFMKDFHTGMVFVDTGITEIPFQLLDALSRFTGLPYTIESCTTKNILSEIIKTQNKLT